MAVTLKTAGAPEEAAAGPYRGLFTRRTRYPLILAFELDDNATAAIALTCELEKRGAEPRVIRAAEFTLPAHLSGSPPSQIAQASSTDEVHERRSTEARALIEGVTGKPCQWRVESIAGDPAFSIVQAAWEQRAQLIVLGNHQHGALDQVMGENTATRVIGKAMIPVIAVRPRMNARPRRILVATDIGKASVEAAHIAANLANPGGTILLVNVASKQVIVDEHDDGQSISRSEGIAIAFRRLGDQIRTGKNIDVEVVALSGDTTEELMAAAEQFAPDLIALASRRHSRVQQLLMGGTSRAIVRAARWPVLVIPPAS
jgi:nucleotide-binding universal stress UspA family protein